MSQKMNSVIQIGSQFEDIGIDYLNDEEIKLANSIWKKLMLRRVNRGKS